MTMDDAFFEDLAAINADMESASARLEQVRGNAEGILVVGRDDAETIAAVAKLQAAQKRLTALLATARD